MTSRAIYKGMDVRHLEAQYNIRAAIPSYPEHFQRWQSASAAVRANLKAQLDLRYGSHPRQTLDLFSAGPNRPVLTFIHGGYWQALDKDHFSFIAPAFAARGISVAVIGYALCPDITMTEMVEQHRMALLWLRRNAEVLGLEAAQFHVAGHSAGGHLAAMLALTDWQALGHPPAAPVSACAISGVFDLEPIRHTSLNARLGLDAETARLLSPLQALAHSPAPQCTLIAAVGGDETEEFLRQQSDFVTAWTGLGGAAETVALPGRNHFTAVDALGESASPLHKRLVDEILRFA